MTCKADAYHNWGCPHCDRSLMLQDVDNKAQFVCACGYKCAVSVHDINELVEDAEYEGWNRGQLHACRRASAR